MGNLLSVNLCPDGPPRISPSGSSGRNNWVFSFSTPHKFHASMAIGSSEASVQSPDLGCMV